MSGARASCTILFYTLRKTASFMCFRHHLTGLWKSSPLGKSATHWLFWSANVCFVVRTLGAPFNKLTAVPAMHLLHPTLNKLFHFRVEISFFCLVQSSFQHSLETEELILVMRRGDTNLCFYRIHGKLAGWAGKVHTFIFAAQKPGFNLFFFISYTSAL